MLKKAIGVLLFCIVGARALPQAGAAECGQLLKAGYGFLFRFMPAEAMYKFQAAIKIAKVIDNRSLYAEALLGAGQATWYAGNFHQAADTVKLALQHFGAGEIGSRIGALRILSNIYDDIGDYEHAFKAAEEAIAINKGFDRMNEMLSMVQMGKLYKNIGDYETARDYYAKVLALGPVKGSYPYRELHHCLGEFYLARGQRDSAAYAYRLACIGYPNSPIIRLRLGELYLLEKQTDSAFYFFDGLYRDSTVSDINNGIGIMIGLGKVARATDDLPAALSWAQKAFGQAMQKGIFEYRVEAAGLLGALYEAKGDAKQALHYQQLYHTLKDAVSSDVYKGQLYAFKQKSLQAEQAAALAALEADKKLAQRTMLIVVLTVGLLALLAIALIVFRHQHEKLRLKQRATELEMQALRAQMNPHFIFNCLTAINTCILNGEPDKATEYLTRFSRLMRMVLVNAGKEAVSLEEELDMLRLYLAMEQLRFKDAFDYTITFVEGMQPSMIQVPCFILQPFCENAIWHGLLHKEGKGHLCIELGMEREQLVVSIQDNGVGMEEAARRKTKNNEPMGQQLTAARLALFNGKKEGTHFTIHDMKDNKGQIAGTKAIIRINTR